MARRWRRAGTQSADPAEQTPLSALAIAEIGSW